MTATRYIIALCPSTPTYLHADTARPFLSEGKYATPDKSQARLFETYKQADAVASAIKGWGGAQRIEAVEVRGTASLGTARDRLTVCANVNLIDMREHLNLADRADRLVRETEAAGFVADARVTPTASSPLGITLHGCDGTITIDWDPFLEAFTYPEEVDDEVENDPNGPHWPEPDCVACNGTGEWNGGDCPCAFPNDADPKHCDGCGDDSDPVEVFNDGDESCALCAQCRAVAEIGDEDRAAFVAGYLTAAVWASTPLREEDDSDDRTFADLGYTFMDLCETSKADARRWCTDFIDANAIRLRRVTKGGRFRFSALGSDFFLSRNGHGAGFFDCVGPADPMRADFDALQQAARVYGSTDQCECNTDGTITIR